MKPNERQLKKLLLENKSHLTMLSLEAGRVRGNRQAYTITLPNSRLTITKGLPDFLAIHPVTNTVAFYEIKTPNDYISTIQAYVFSLLVKTGHNVVMVKWDKGLRYSQYTPLSLSVSELVSRIRGI